MVDDVRQKLIFPRIPDDIDNKMRTFLSELFEVLRELNRGPAYIEGDLNLGGAVIGLGLNITSVTGAYTVKASDDIILCTGTFTVTLPKALGVNNQIFCVKNVSTGVITLDGDGSETIDGSSSKLLYQYEFVPVVSNGSTWYLLRHS